MIDYNSYGSVVLPNTDADCNTLKTAMKGFGTDEKAIINLVCNRTNLERVAIKKRYSSLFGKDLIKELKSELSGHFEDAIIALFDTPFELDCKALNKAMKGIGTNEDTLIEIITTRGPQQLYQDRLLYQQMFGKDLIKHVESETSGTFRKILVAILQCQRHDESFQINAPELQMEAQKLYQAGPAKWGTDESTFVSIFSTRSAAEIRTIAQYYQQMCGKSLLDMIESEFSGDAKKALKAILYACISPSEWFAIRIRDSIKGFGTKDTQLIRLIISRSEIDIPEIRQAYQLLYKRDMIADIKSDTSGDYEKLLVTLCSRI